MKSSPGGFSRESSGLSSTMSIKSVKQDVQERLEALLREKTQLLWHLEKLEALPTRSVPPLPPELGGPPRPVLDPYASDQEKKEVEAALAVESGPVGLEASIEIARQQFASGLLNLGRSKTEAISKKSDILKGIPEMERAKSSEPNGRDSRSFESPSHTTVALPKHGEECGKPSTLTLTKPAFECTRRESEETKEHSQDQSLKFPNLVKRVSKFTELTQRKRIFYVEDEAENVSEQQKKLVREKLFEMGYVKQRKTKISEDDFMRKFIDRKARGISKKSKKLEPLSDRLVVFYEKLTTMNEVEEKGDTFIFDLPPLKA